MKKFNKEVFMKLFIGFAIPMVMALIYDIVMKKFEYSDIMGIVLAVVFLIVWYKYAGYVAKSSIDYKLSLFTLHGPIIIGSILTAVMVIIYPDVPAFLEMIAFYTNLYTLALQSITSPIILFLTYFFEADVYGLYLNLGCILALISMMGIYTIGYDKYRED